MSEAAPTPVTNKYATAALVVGILAAIFYEFFIPSIAAIILGALGMNQATALQNDGVKITGKGKSVAGLVLGLVYLFCGFIAANTDIL